MHHFSHKSDKCQESWNIKCHEMSIVVKCQMSWNVKCLEMSNVMKSWCWCWIYDSKQKHQALHTSERTIVPRTVIFYNGCCSEIWNLEKKHLSRILCWQTSWSARKSQNNLHFYQRNENAKLIFRNSMHPTYSAFGKQACSSHHQIVIWICFWFSICQAQKMKTNTETAILSTKLLPGILGPSYFSPACFIFT